MKFARGLVVASVIAACVPLAAACGSGPDLDLFSPSGISSGHAGANNAHAGAGTAGEEDGTAGSSVGSGGNTSAGDAGENNGSSGASLGGMSSAEGGKSGDAGEASAGAPRGGGAGASAGGAGGAASGGAGAGGTVAGGASGAGASGAGASGAGGAGGTVAGGAGAGGAGAGGAGAGGAGAGGASVGGGGAGGAGGANSCPALAPVDDTECKASTPSSCFYSGMACSCLTTGPGPAGPRKWACYGTPEKCPGAKPTAGNSCTQNIGAACPYPNQDYCICKGDAQDASWSCQSPTATCLATKPPPNLVCGHVRTCQYSDVSCFCNGSKWSCLGD